MVKLTQTKGVSGPSSSLGITRFFDVDTGGPKLSHQLVFGLVIAFAILVLVLRLFFFK